MLETHYQKGEDLLLKLKMMDVDAQDLQSKRRRPTIKTQGDGR